MLRSPWVACAWLACLTCTEAPREQSDQPATVVAGESDDTVAHVRRLKSVIRADAAVSYEDECTGISIPEDAFIEVELTGGGLPELAVPFGRVECNIGPTRFSGTGGVLVQFWIGSGGPVRLLLEQQMHGFTPTHEGLITMQHGAFCPDGAGPDQCRVVYRWNDRDRRLHVVERTLASTLDTVPRMRYELDSLWR